MFFLYYFKNYKEDKIQTKDNSKRRKEGILKENSLKNHGLLRTKKGWDKENIQTKDNSKRRKEGTLKENSLKILLILF